MFQSRVLRLTCLLVAQSTLDASMQTCRQFLWMLLVSSACSVNTPIGNRRFHLHLHVVLHCLVSSVGVNWVCYTFSEGSAIVTFQLLSPTTETNQEAADAANRVLEDAKDSTIVVAGETLSVNPKPVILTQEGEEGEWDGTQPVQKYQKISAPRGLIHTGCATRCATQCKQIEYAPHETQTSPKEYI